jgi:hypothetical protein
MRGAEKYNPDASAPWLSQFSRMWDTFTMRITAVVENNVIKLPMNVPDGTRVEVVIPSNAPYSNTPPAGSFFDSIRELIGSVEGSPDMAARFAH